MKRLEYYNDRVALRTLYNVRCSDWDLDWGFSHHKLGRLYWDPTDEIFIWRGHCQGRQNQVWNKNSEYHFKIVKEEINGIVTDIITKTWSNNGILPVYSEVKKSLKLLETLTKNIIN